ncbi:hypothetical protein EDD11_001733 [Mortierella claussenii]|nr:hypothetical protein EDD11_001733 [Mortierella claussenii]
MSTELLINTLQHLAVTQTLDISRNQDLDAVAKWLQVDADARIELSGAGEAVWGKLAMILRRTVEDGLDPDHVEQLMFLFRIVRNAVAGVCENQDQARVAQVPALIQEILSQAGHTHYGNIAYIMMLRAGVQALSNLLTGNEESKDRIWELLLVKAPSPSCDQNLLSTLAAVEDETVVLSTVMLCYNCIFESEKRSALLYSTAAGKKLLFQLINESHATSNNDERKSFEMIYTFFNYLIGQGRFQDLFETLQSRSDEDEQEYKIRYHGEEFHDQSSVSQPISKMQELRIEEIEDEESTGEARDNDRKTKTVKELSYLSGEQVILLKMLDSRIYSHHQQQQKLFQQQQQQLEGTESAVSLESIAFLTTVFAKISVLTIEILETLDQPGVGKHGVEDLANLSSGVILLLGCFTHLSLYEDGMVTDVTNDRDVEDKVHRLGEQAPVPNWFKTQHLTMINGRLVENAIELLRQADKSLARVTKPATPTPQTGSAPTTKTVPSMMANTESTVLSNTSTEQGQQSFFVGLKRDIVRLIGNLAYRSRYVQDLIRDCNGLIVMLSQCNIDDANPYLREYAILAMKNILAGNLQNQALIEELQPIEAVDHPVLQEARVSAYLDAKTGRPVLTQQKS